MNIKIYQVDAFALKAFSGNSAAVCPLEQWLDDAILHGIAMENNLAETAFYVKQADRYQIRWITPTVEVDLCGHATLATAFVLFNYENHEGDVIYFDSIRNGELTVSRQGKLLTLNFPTDVFEEVKPEDNAADSFNIKPRAIYKGKTDYMFVFEKEEDIANIIPDYSVISKLDVRGIIVTAKGNEVDFVSRFFGPQSGINEDPVTGSAHTTLTPYWAKKLGKNKLSALQLSQRRGYLQCKYLGDRAEISGECVLYMTGEIVL
ncbi:MAG: PhzF family phenazine biosynthesis protein [Prevotellaceae bacterium]|jgi:PhzF family phenazine biosynthesis protein|nr:PhzF family phenazine biosynthesis protein [Prevotellaceae bacterium]